MEDQNFNEENELFFNSKLKNHKELVHEEQRPFKYAVSSKALYKGSTITEHIKSEENKNYKFFVRVIN